MTVEPGTPGARIDTLTKVYDGRAVVRDVSVDFPPGRSYFLVGPNGSGKTTTLETLVGLRRPTSGRTELLGLPSGDPRLRSRIRVCLQGASLHQQVTTREHFEYIAKLFQAPRAQVSEVAEQFDIVDLLPRRFGKLSGGQQRRVQVAACMFGDGEFVLLDEPTSGVDIESRLSLWASVRSAMAQRSMTLLATTHDLSEAEDYADEVVVMRQGRLVAQGSPSQIVSATGLVAVLSVPTAAVEGLPGGDSAVEGSDLRRVLSSDTGTTTLGYLDRASLQRDIRSLTDRQVHATERSPRLSDAYLMGFDAETDTDADADAAGAQTDAGTDSDGTP